MTELSYHRTILAVAGPDAASFLQGITTQDMNALREGMLIFTAFLSPQGKLLFDAFAWRTRDTIYLDTATAHAEGLLTFLTRYKLRAKVTLSPSALMLSLLPPDDTEGLTDPRNASLPRRFYDTTPMAGLSEEEYHAARLAYGAPEAAYDSKGDDVAMDIGYDALHAISFTKGCYVGQEVTARMHYKHINRKSILRAEADEPLPEAFTPIMAGALTLGALRSSQAEQGLALVRLDTWEEALISGSAITCADIPIRLTWPEWASAKREAWRQGKLASAT